MKKVLSLLSIVMLMGVLTACSMPDLPFGKKDEQTDVVDDYTPEDVTEDYTQEDATGHRVSDTEDIDEGELEQASSEESNEQTPSEESDGLTLSDDQYAEVSSTYSTALLIVEEPEVSYAENGLPVGFENWTGSSDSSIKIWSVLGLTMDDFIDSDTGDWYEWFNGEDGTVNYNSKKVSGMPDVIKVSVVTLSENLEMYDIGPDSNVKVIPVSYEEFKSTYYDYYYPGMYLTANNSIAEITNFTFQSAPGVYQKSSLFESSYTTFKNGEIYEGELEQAPTEEANEETTQPTVVEEPATKETKTSTKKLSFKEQHPYLFAFRFDGTNAYIDESAFTQPVAGDTFVGDSQQDIIDGKAYIASSYFPSTLVVLDKLTGYTLNEEAVFVSNTDPNMTLHIYDMSASDVADWKKTLGDMSEYASYDFTEKSISGQFMYGIKSAKVQTFNYTKRSGISGSVVRCVMAELDNGNYIVIENTMLDTVLSESKLNQVLTQCLEWSE